MYRPVGATEDFDWRLNGWAFVAEDAVLPSGQIAKKGARLTAIKVVKLTRKKNLQLSLPNASALLLHSALCAEADAATIRISCGIDSSIKRVVTFETDTHGFDYLEKKASSVFLCITALEAFANEMLTDDVTYQSKDRNGDSVTLNREEIERRLSLDEKLSVVLPKIFGTAPPKSSSCWAPYIETRRLRDRIIHWKNSDRKASDIDEDNAWSALMLSPRATDATIGVIDFFMKVKIPKPGWYEGLKFSQKAC